MRPTNLALNLIRLDGGTQVRLSMDQATVAKYAELMTDTETPHEFDPVQVFFDGVHYWLWDGFHRFRAAEKNGAAFIRAIVRPGTQADAVWESLSANRKHGKPLTTQDKANAIRVAVAARPERSDRSIAAHIGVSGHTVAKYRQEMKAGAQIAHLDERLGGDGKVYPARPTPDPSAIPFDVPGAPTGEIPAIEEPPTAQLNLPTKDEAGHSLPARLIPVFARRPDITRLMDRISAIKGEVSLFIDGGNELFAGFIAAAFDADMMRAYHRLSNARPYSVCPYCNGDGCQPCLTRGWIGKLTYDTAPIEMK